MARTLPVETRPFVKAVRGAGSKAFVEAITLRADTRRPGSMLTPGDVVVLDLGVPAGSEAGLRRPAIVVTAVRILRGGPHVVQVVPLTRTTRASASEVRIDPDEDNQLTGPSSAQCQHVRSVATSRIQTRTGNVGPVVLGEVRETIALLMDL